MEPETNVVQLSYGRDFDVRYAAMIYDALAMLIDSGDYGDELIEWAIQRQEAYARSVLSPTQQRLIEGHRKVPSLT